MTCAVISNADKMSESYGLSSAAHAVRQCAHGQAETTPDYPFAINRLTKPRYALQTLANLPSRRIFFPNNTFRRVQQNLRFCLRNRGRQREAEKLESPEENAIPAVSGALECFHKDLNLEPTD